MHRGKRSGAIGWGLIVRNAYLLPAHDNSAHLRRLVRRLAAPETAFYVHINAKSDLDAFAGMGSSVRFCARRVNCAWGDISLVKATLELMKCAASEPRGFDYFILLSGACYLLQTPEYIEEFLIRHRGTKFIELFALPTVTYNKSLERITRFWIRKGRPLSPLRWPFQHLLNKLLPLRNHKKSLAGRDPVTGSQWWCLIGKAVQHVLDVAARQPALYRFCKFDDCPDEFYFQVILLNSRFRETISHSLTFTYWAPGANRPAMLDASYLPQLAELVILNSEFNNCPGEKCEVLFGRKFSDPSSSLLDAIDAVAARRQRKYSAKQHLT